MAHKFYTINQYRTEVKRVSRQAVLKAISKGKKNLLPNVISYKKMGRDWILKVSI